MNRSLVAIGMLAGWMLTASAAWSIDPVGTAQGNDGYVALAQSEGEFLSVAQVSVPGAFGSGVWLGGEYVLTARHVTSGGPADVVVTWQDGTSVRSVEYWDSELDLNVNDLAIVRLESTPDLPANYTPSRVRDTTAGVVGNRGTMVGYGGIGRSAGHNTIHSASDTGEILAVRTDATTLELGANLIPGDSGGPLFVGHRDGSYSVIGVAAVIFNQFDVWSNPVAYAEQIEFGLETNHWSFFQNGADVPLLGDLTLDGRIDHADVDAFVDGWLSEHEVVDLAAWQSGDLNGDRITDLADFAILNREFPEIATLVANQLSGVPEPGTGLLLLLGCLFWSRGNRVRRV